VEKPLAELFRAISGGYLDLFSRGGRDLKQAQYLLENRIQTNWTAV
jgi:hypothetical protein